MTVIIYGSGPAGLLAALAAEQTGNMDVVIHTNAQGPSIIRGAQYLHAPIPYLTKREPEFHVHYSFKGTPENYAIKAYRDPTQPVSWERWYGRGEVPAWRMYDAYMRLYEKFQDKMVPGEITEERHKQLHALWSPYRVAFINTIPRHVFCDNEDHVFRSAEHWVRTETGSPVELPPHIIYSGSQNDEWHRMSWFGNGDVSYEYGHAVPQSERILKPLYTNCTCCPELIHVGRFGKWDKGQLVTDAYEEVIRALQ